MVPNAGGEISIPRLWEIVRDIRLKGQENVKQRMREVLEGMMPAVDARKKNYRARIKKGYSDQLARLFVAGEVFRKEYRRAANDALRDIFDFDCSVGFRSWKGQVYLIPYAGDGVYGVLDFLGELSYLEDFHYQNQTDRPDGVSSRDWKKRERVWDGVIDSDRWQDLLVLEICRYEFMYLLFPEGEMAREIHKLESKEGGLKGASGA
jgi:hypothetical protein